MAAGLYNAVHKEICHINLGGRAEVQRIAGTHGTGKAQPMVRSSPFPALRLMRHTAPFRHASRIDAAIRREQRLADFRKAFGRLEDVGIRPRPEQPDNQRLRLALALLLLDLFLLLFFLCFQRLFLVGFLSIP